MAIKIQRTDGIYTVICAYNDRHVLARAGFIFNKAIKRWTTTSDDLALAFYDNCIGDAKLRLDNLKIIKEELVAASFAEDYDGTLLCPEGLAYMPFQRAGIAFALERDNVLIADSMGLGKTPQSLGVINNTLDARKVLIVVPASLKINWARESEKWLMHGLTVGMTKAKSKPAIQADGSKKSVTEHIWPNTDVVIMNYEQLEQYHDIIRATAWDILICDEAHVLKNPKAIKCKHIFGYRGKKKSDRVEPIIARKRIFLTGTPILNKPIDLWVMIQACAPTVFGNYIQFTKRYCDAFETHWGTDASGASNLEELQEKLRSSFMIRRMKADVLKDLPSKTRQVVVLPNEGLSKVVKKEKQVFADNLKALALINGEAVEADFDEITEAGLSNIMSNISGKITDFDSLDMEEFMATHFEAIAHAREEIGLAKAKMVVEYVKILQESTDKVVIFGVHKLFVAKVKESFPNAAIVVGGMTPEAKQAEVDRFRNDPECREIILNLAAGSVGWTLVEASHLVMGELGFVPPILEQAEDRIYRIGQKNAVWIHYLVVENSIESKLMDIFMTKLEIIDKALNRQ